MSSADNTKYILKTRWLQKINVTNNNNGNNKNRKKEDDKIGLRTKPEEQHLFTGRATKILAASLCRKTDILLIQ